MQIYIISKAFLGIYRYLNALTKSIDRVVKVKSVNSSSFYDYYKSNTMDQTNEIMTLINKKITLINIKVIVDKILQQLNCEQARVLTLKYIDNMPSAQISELLQVNSRTYFRRANTAIKEFEKRLELYFNNNPSLYKSIINEPWINKLVSSYTKNTKVNCEIDGSFIYKTLIKHLKSTSA